MTTKQIDRLRHAQLCERAARWLRSNRKCDPVLGKVASCREIPDAIGWSSTWKHRGSIVVECKTSRADFYADAEKYLRYRHPGMSHAYKANSRKAELIASGFIEEQIPCMGTYRFFMCEPEVITVEMVKERRPDHGLLYLIKRHVDVVLEAPYRKDPDYASEVHYLRFALIHLRENLIRNSIGVDLMEATKMFGKDALTLPGVAS